LMSAGLWSVIKPRRFAVGLMVILVAAQAADCLRYAPDYLSYFTPFVRPSRAHDFLTDSTLDWGQGLIALRRYQRSHPHERFSLAYFGSVDRQQYGVEVTPLPEDGRATGTIVVSATHLSGQYLQNPAAYHWLMMYVVRVDETVSASF